MCGRVVQAVPDRVIRERFQVPEAPLLPFRYNLAPSQDLAAVRQGARGRELVLLCWGLVPSWADDPKMGNRLTNARAETVAEKASFRTAFKRRRCLIPVNGYYEWQKTEDGKQPYFIHPANDDFFALAGLWEEWEGAGGEVIDSCAILTTGASETVRHIHDRMPVIVPPEDFEVWLDPRVQEAGALLRPSQDVAFHPVSSYVNNARNEGPQCIEPLAA